MDETVKMNKKFYDKKILSEYLFFTLQKKISFKIYFLIYEFQFF